MTSTNYASGSTKQLRLLTLFSLFLLDGTYTVLRRYSRGVRHESFNVNEVLLITEIIKLSFSTYMVSNGEKRRKLRHLIFGSKKMFLLAIIYGVYNILSFYALARVGAGTFVIIAQGKTLTTAVFSSLMLGKRFSWTQIRALLSLVTGMMLFVMPTLELANASDANFQVVNGCVAEVAGICLSGFASIYFEKAIKNDAAADDLTIWERNVQLGFHSIVIYILLLVVNPTARSLDDHPLFFANWTPLAVVLSIVGACGGLLVALTINYGDSVLKTLATSGSIIYAALLDRFFLTGPLTGQMSISACIVILAISSYAFDATPNIKSSHWQQLTIE